jgi:hypothetical protein
MMTSRCDASGPRDVARSMSCTKLSHALIAHRKHAFKIHTQKRMIQEKINSAYAMAKGQG